MKKRSFFVQIFFGICACLCVGLVSSYLGHAGESPWYASLNKPWFTPPSWVFAPVWTILYVMMGIAFGLIVRSWRQNKVLLLMFLLQLILNGLWSPLFFHYKRVDLACYDILLLWGALLGTLLLARKQPLILLLLMPYFVWVSFAVVLNVLILTYNTPHIG